MIPFTGKVHPPLASTINWIKTAATGAFMAQTSPIRASAVSRMVHSGAKPITTLALACELQRDWSRGHGDTLRAIFQWYFAQLRRHQDRPSY